MSKLNANDRFEIIADLFHRATGMLAPGKDQPYEMENTDEDRQKCFNAWRDEQGFRDAVEEIWRINRLADATDAVVEAAKGMLLNVSSNTPWGTCKITNKEILTWAKGECLKQRKDELNVALNALTALCNAAQEDSDEQETE